MIALSKQEACNGPFRDGEPFGTGPAANAKLSVAVMRYAEPASVLAAVQVDRAIAVFGIGTAKSLQGLAGLFWALNLATEMHWSRTWVRRTPTSEFVPTDDLRINAVALAVIGTEIATKSTSC